jgi:UDP-N-acetylglucosamine 2-epimerase (non-hydrolysing)/UDP-GlcNAc3NAcA epimerase
MLFSSAQTAVHNLEREGLTRNVYNVGDVMCDAALYYSERMVKREPRFYFDRATPLFGAHPMPEQWYLSTIHRAENTDTPEKIYEILSAFESLDHPVIFSVHPRSEGLVRQAFEKHPFANTIAVKPFGYIDMLFYLQGAIKVITDSGGLQTEAYIFRTPCVTVRDQTEHIETLEGGHNVLCKPSRADILEKVFHVTQDWDNHPDYYGTGHASEKIATLLERTKF